MSFTTVAWSESLDAGGILVPVNAVPDQHIKTEGDSVYVSQYNILLGGMACVGASATRARLVSPTLRRLAPFYITPLTLALYPSSHHLHNVDISRRIKLDIDEQLEFEEDGNPASAEQVTGVAWLADSPVAKVEGEIFRVKASVTGAITGGVWDFYNLSFDDDLPVGTYDCVGLVAVVPTGVVARLVPVGGTNRPGVPCSHDENLEDLSKTFVDGNMGVFCSFPHNNPPSLEILGSASASSTTYKVYLDLIKTA